jgi:hypothetical protein
MLPNTFSSRNRFGRGSRWLYGKSAACTARRCSPALLLAFLAAIGAGGLIVLHFNDELARARNAARQGSLIANTAVGPIGYTETGASIALLSIHGAGGGYDQGLTNAADLAGRGFHVIAPSRFGYLCTPVPREASPAGRRMHRRHFGTGAADTDWTLFLKGLRRMLTGC